MKKILIGFVLFLIVLTLFSGLQYVTECKVIETGIFAGRTVCFLGTVDIIAGKTAEIDVIVDK